MSLLLLRLLLSATPAAPGTLRVCEDPNNLPFSNARGEGFENQLAELVARELGDTVQYTWFPQRRGFLRNTLNAGRCDVVMGVPAGLEHLATTKPYYRSSYVFVYGPAAPRAPPITRLDDPRLRSMRIGVPLVGEDGENPVPLLALAAHRLDRNARGYLVTGNYADENPPARLIQAVSAGDVDLAIAWGPLAGYFAARASPPLAVAPMAGADAPVGQPIAFDIAMGVRSGDESLRTALDAILERRREEIDVLLRAFHVPMVEELR